MIAVAVKVPVEMPVMPEMNVLADPRRGASSNNGRIPKRPCNQMGRPVTKGIGIPGNLKECESREESAREREERDRVRVQQRLLRAQHNVNNCAQ